MVRPRRPLSDEDLERFGEANPGYRVEREADGSLHMTAACFKGGAKNAMLAGQMYLFWMRAGGMIFDSSTGFTLPGGAVLCPDAAWMRAERWAAIASSEQTFARQLPDLWIELRSETDRRDTLMRKLERVRRAGTSCVVLVDAVARDVWSAGDVPPGFTLDVDAIFRI